MKKVFYAIPILIVSILFSVQLSAQGVRQLWGITTTGGTEDLGAIFKAHGDGMTKGVYFITIQSKTGNKQLRFVKQ